MIYAQFYQPDLSGAISEACGDRSVVIIDGRLSRPNIGAIAEKEAARRGYVAWRIFRGDSFTRSAPVSPLNYVRSGATVSNPAWLSAHGM